MKKTGKWLLIFGALALVSAIAFGFTIAAYGVRNNDYSVNVGGTELINGLKINTDLFGGTQMSNTGLLFRDGQTNIKYDFESNKEYSGSFDSSGLSDIRLHLASCKATVTPTSAQQVNVTYKTGSRPLTFTAVLEDGVLDIKENISFNLFSFGSFTKSELTVELPEKLYRSLDIDVASGSVTTDGLKLEKLSANLASGDFDLGLYAEEIKLNVASGKASVKNISDSRASEIDVNAASGTINISGFGADETKVKLASGKINLDGISGEVTGNIMSGTLTLVYSEWNDDLKVELASGKCDVTLPEGSGAAAKLECLSGSTEIDLDGSSAKLTKTASGTFGGSNVHNVEVKAASGSVKIHN